MYTEELCGCRTTVTRWRYVKSIEYENWPSAFARRKVVDL